MRINTMFSKILAVTMIGALLVVPMTASAQSSRDHRQQSKNQWRNLAYGAAAVGIFGLLKHNSTLTVAGAAGAAYSAYRYEQDRKSQSRYNTYGGRGVDRYGSSGGRYSYADSGYQDDQGCGRGHGKKGGHHDNGRHLGWYKH